MTRFVLLVTCINILMFSLSNLSNAADNGTFSVHIGAVLDTSSPIGSMADMCIRMAISDFYQEHPNYTTRLKLHVRNAESVLDANFAVVDLLNVEKVLAILGPQDAVENIYMAELGETVHVPVISFTARSSIVPYKHNRYFVKATADDSFQAKALAAICQGFQWPAVDVIYEDTDYGNQFFSHLNKVLQDVEIGLDYVTSIPTSIRDRYLLKKLEKIKTKKTRVILVHLSPSLGYRLFRLAKSVGIMSEGYAWIVSDSLSNFMDSVDLATRDAMDGVVGIRPYVSQSAELENFQHRWKRNMLLNGSKESKMELNVYGLWAYDAVTALAIAVEKIGLVNSTALHGKKSNGNNSVQNLRISNVGSRLLKELTSTKFRGLAGEFHLVDGKLKQSIFEIFNVYGSGEKTLGFWTPDEGIIRDISGERTYSTSTHELRNAMWPGDSTTRPRGWTFPATGNLRVGLPWKDGFTEFVHATVNHSTKHTYGNGFAVDIFNAAMMVLPFPINYEFHIYNDTRNTNWSYDEMLHKIPQEFDMVVADTTIRAPRTEYVEFSLPYCESGVVLVVKNKKPFEMWIFLKPLRWDLWLTIFASAIWIAVILRLMEHNETANNEGRVNQPLNEQNRQDVNQDHPVENRQVINPGEIRQEVNEAHPVENNPGEIRQEVNEAHPLENRQEMNQALPVENRQEINQAHPAENTHRNGFKMIYWSPLAILAFPESDKVTSHCSLFVLVVWTFMAFILMQSYTANLSAILTVDQLKFAFSDSYYVGYQEASFMKEFLTKQLHISELRLRSYKSCEEYHHAMSLGSEHGDIDAIFDEIPYMKIFLNKYDSKYKMVGPSYKTGGFGFAFPVGSPLVSHFSKAIVNVTQGPEINAIEQKNFGPGYSSQDPLSSSISQGTSSLTAFQFGGLFIIVGIVTVAALCISSRIYIFTKINQFMGWISRPFRSSAKNADGERQATSVQNPQAAEEPGPLAAQQAGAQGGQDANDQEHPLQGANEHVDVPIPINDANIRPI